MLILRAQQQLLPGSSRSLRRIHKNRHRRRVEGPFQAVAHRRRQRRHGHRLEHAVDHYVRQHRRPGPITVIIHFIYLKLIHLQTI